MITTSSKYFYAAAAVAMLAAVVYGYSTGGGNVGPLSFGYKGGVGDHLGYGLLMSAAALSLFLGFAMTAFRDADPDAVAEIAGTELPPAVAPAGPSYWPIVGAFSVGLTVVGLAVNNVFFVAGLIGIGAVAVEWTVQAWADRATGDPATNREIRNRIMFPLEIPIAGALGIGIVVVGISRILLAVTKENAVWIAIGVAFVVFVLGTLLSMRPTLRSDILAGVLALAAVAVIAGGIVGAVVGEREFEHHGTEHEGESEGESEGEGGTSVDAGTDEPAADASDDEQALIGVGS